MRLTESGIGPHDLALDAARRWDRPGGPSAGPLVPLASPPSREPFAILPPLPSSPLSSPWSLAFLRGLAS